MDNFEKCWLNYRSIGNVDNRISKISCINVDATGKCIDNTVLELKTGFKELFDINLNVDSNENNSIVLKFFDESDASFTDGFKPEKEGFAVYYNSDKNKIVISATDDNGILYGAFALLRYFQCDKKLDELKLLENPVMPFRMIDHWDNMWGDIERGYSGNSFFYVENKILINDRTVAYARMMASVGINAIAINNVNVHAVETLLITDTYLSQVKQINDIFNSYGIKLYLSVNFAAPVELGVTEVSDPFDEGVIKWWNEATKHVYEVIPDFGGYLVKADSEGRPGPFTYGRTHADGANMLARKVGKYGGIVIWRCFVYNCRQDWRDRKTDRARAGYDNFIGIDGQFEDNVVLQIKNGPMDFQVREPVSPLFGGLRKTNMFLEVQAAQEYTGQQRHICYLVPMWKEILDFNTYATETATVKNIVSGNEYGNKVCGMAAVTNTGNDENWTGHDFAAANLFGYAKLCWNPELSADSIAKEWASCTFGYDKTVIETVCSILNGSWHTYEKYTSPLGIGWMVNPSNHYGPNVDGYEYDRWGTYHRADRDGLGVDRTVAKGTGYTAQYNAPWCDRYEKVETTPEELLLFFHYIRYDYVLSTGKTLIQHIYDTHFEGVEEVEAMLKKWESLSGKVDEKVYNRVFERLNIQLESSIEWRDRINTYFYRMSGVSDSKGRTIY